MDRAGSVGDVQGHGGPGWRLAAVALAVGSMLGAFTPAAPAAAAPVPVEARTEPLIDVALRQARMFALHQLARTDLRLAQGRFPTVAPGDRFWHTSGIDGWLAGFWPGRLWLAYQLSGHRRWARRAATDQAPLSVRASDSTTHDLGFLLQTSFGHGAALAGRDNDADVVRQAAATLASRYVPAARAIRSWNGPPGQVTVIVDNLMNLELLFWAADHGGSEELRDIAVRHALTSRRWHVRPDGSTFHVVRFDERTGRVVWRGTVQGLRNRSTWARGQSWAVHGFTTAYAESGDPRLLEAARRTARWTVSHLPGDGVPWWDYDAPGTRRDTTAAAVLASGLLGLARLDPDPDRRHRWRRAGMHTLRSLVGPRYLAKGTGAWSVLLHGRHSPTYEDSGVTYGDYYLLEALARVQLLPSRRPALPVTNLVREPGGGLVADLGSRERIGGLSVRWRAGGTVATRFRIQTSLDGTTWDTARGGVSSGASSRFETYDLRDRSARYLRVRPLGASDGGVGLPVALRVRG